MERADVPTEGNGMIERLQAVPRFSCGRHVNHCEQNAGHNLHDEDDERGAAENVKPAGGVAWHGMFGGFANGGRKLQARIEPVADFSDQAHGNFPYLNQGRGISGSGQFACFDEKFSFFNFVWVFEQAAFGRAGRARAVFVISATVAGAHE